MTTIMYEVEMVRVAERSIDLDPEQEAEYNAFTDGKEQIKFLNDVALEDARYHDDWDEDVVRVSVYDMTDEDA